VGVQDGSFEAFRRGVAGAIQHTSFCLTKLAGPVIQDIRLSCITVDGLDATNSLLKGLSEWSYDVIILGGATFAGFNVIDVEHVNKVTRKPVIVFSSQLPDMDATLSALRKHFPDWRLRWRRYEALGKIHELFISDYPPIYYEVVGGSPSLAESILREQAITGRIPEAVRVADIIAKGVSPVFRDLRGSHCETEG
jgi:endonuclease V-like protein UPF0215 family